MLVPIRNHLDQLRIENVGSKIGCQKDGKKPSKSGILKSHTSKLEYLDLAETKPSNKELAHNLAVVYDRTCLSSRVHLKNFKEILEKQEKLEKEVHKLCKEIVTLNKVVIENRPLTKTEVVGLVKEIAKQPKLIEAEALRLTEDLNNKLNRVEEILRKVERWLAA